MSPAVAPVPSQACFALGAFLHQGGKTARSGDDHAQAAVPIPLLECRIERRESFLLAVRIESRGLRFHQKQRLPARGIEPRAIDRSR
jgi:hypothetical protein